MKLIIGLGNIGKEYEQTRHNLGFMVVDELIRTYDMDTPSENKDMRALVVKGKIGDSDVVLAKPTTFMNLSGLSVEKLARFYKVPLSDIWVVHDELDLVFGKLRVRQGGGTAGHNGLKSIVDSLGDGFGRYRIGIANPRLRNPIAADAFVLAKFNKEEQEALPAIIRQTADIVVDHLHSELADTTYNLFSSEA